MTTVDIREQIKRLRRLARNPSGKTMKRWGAEYGTFEPLRNMLNEDADTMEKLLAVYEAVLNMLDDWDNDRIDIGSIGSLEQALAAVQTRQEPTAFEMAESRTKSETSGVKEAAEAVCKSRAEPKQEPEMPYTVACRCGKLWINLDADERYCRSCGFDLIGDPVESGQAQK